MSQMLPRLSGSVRERLSFKMQIDVSARAVMPAVAINAILSGIFILIAFALLVKKSMN